MKFYAVQTLKIQALKNFWSVLRCRCAPHKFDADYKVEEQKYMVFGKFQDGIQIGMLIRKVNE